MLAVKTRTWRKLGGGLCEPVDETACVCACVCDTSEVADLSLSHGNNSSVFCLVTGGTPVCLFETSMTGDDIGAGLATDLTWREDDADG